MGHRSRFHAILKLSLALSLSFGSTFAHAEESPKDEAILITGDAVRIDSATQDNIEFVYDAASVKEAPVTPISLASLRAASREMSSESYQRRLREEVVIPVSSMKLDRLDRMEELTAQEIDTLVARKNLYLSRIAKTLKLMQLPTAVINKTLLAVNEAFFENSKIVARANRHITCVGLGVSGGAGLPLFLVKHLRRVPMLSGLPDKAGFWFAVSAGVAITQVNENGWHKIKIEPIVEFRQASKILAPFATVGAGLFLAQGLETTSDKPAWNTKFTKVNGFSLTQNENMISFSSGLGIGLSAGPLTILQGEGQAFLFGREGIRRVYEMVREAVTIRPTRRAPLTCSAIFAAT